jgi:hypothetical protein
MVPDANALVLRPDIGANASAEEADEGVEDQAVKVNNIVHSFRYQSTQFDKKSYLTYLKGMLPTTSLKYPARSERRLT